MQDKRLKKLLSQPTTISQTTRKKTIDFSKLGQKITLSDYSCHRCKTMIPVNEENICNGPLPIPVHEEKLKKNQTLSGNSQLPKQKKIEPCQKRFCNECLQKYNKDSWVSLSKNAELWICPFCLEQCSCSQCHRKRNKEGIIKSQFLSQFDTPQPKNINKDLNTQPTKLDKKDKQSLKQVEHAKTNDKSVNKRTEKSILKAKHKDIIQENKSKAKYERSESKLNISKQLLNQSDQQNKNSNQDLQWNAYQQSKQKFLACLNQYDWNQTIPALEILKERLNNRAL